MKQYLRLLVLVLMCVLPAALDAVAGQLTPPGLNERQRRIFMELNAELNNEIVMYGRVIDLDGNPVPDAVVTLRARVAGAAPPDDFPIVEVRTNPAGAFVARAFGELIELDKIDKPGYLYRFQYNPERMLRSARPEKRHGPGFEPDKPVVFRVRKLAPVAFVVLHNMTFGLKPGSSTELDLIQRHWVEPDRVFTHKMMFSDWHPDLRLSVEGEPGKMRLILEAPDPDSGFVVEKHEFGEMMTEAPVGGYKPRVEVPVKKGESPLEAYVKCQGGLFYARIHVEFSENRPGIVAINATSFTNLAKERGLEYIPSVASQYDEEVYGAHTRDLIRRADLLSGKPIEMPKAKP